MTEEIGIKRIVAEWLVEHGYDGLYTEECNCLLDDLMPCCADDRIDCCAGYRTECDGSCGNDICDFHVVGPEKPK